MIFLSCGPCVSVKALDRREGDDALAETLVDECDVVRENLAHGWAPILLDSGLVEAVECGLQLRAERREGRAPRLVRRLVDVWSGHDRKHHRSVAGGFHQLVDDGDRGSLDRRHAGPIEDQAPAGTGEKREDDRMLGQDVPSENPARVVVETEHRGIQGEDVLPRSIPGARSFTPHDDVHIGRQFGRPLGLSVCCLHRDRQHSTA